MVIFSGLGTLCFWVVTLLSEPCVAGLVIFVCRINEHFSPVELSAADSFTHLVPRDRGRKIMWIY